MAEHNKPSERQKSTSEIVLLVARRIREARKKAGLSQTELADKVSLTSTAISNYEAALNDMPLSRLGELADALGVSYAWLVQEAEQAASDSYVVIVRIEQSDTHTMKRILDAIPDGKALPLGNNSKIV